MGVPVAAAISRVPAYIEPPNFSSMETAFGSPCDYSINGFAESLTTSVVASN